MFGDDRGFFMETWNARDLRRARARLALRPGQSQPLGARTCCAGCTTRSAAAGETGARVAGASSTSRSTCAARPPRFGTVGRASSCRPTNKRMLWVPPGFAHGFLALEDGTDFLYKCTDFYAPAHERTLALERSRRSASTGRSTDRRADRSPRRTQAAEPLAESGTSSHEVLDLGAGGQVGRALGAAAPARTQIVALDRAALRHHAMPDAVARGDRETAAPDIVFNAAAYTAVDKAESEPTRRGALNARCRRAVIAAAAAAAGARLVHVSTDFVFDGDGSARPTRRMTRPPAGRLRRRPSWPARRGRCRRAGGADRAHRLGLCAAAAEFRAHDAAADARSKSDLRVVADQIGTPTYAPALAGLWGLVAKDARGIHHYTDSRQRQLVRFRGRHRGRSARQRACSAARRGSFPIRANAFPTRRRSPFLFGARQGSDFDPARRRLRHIGESICGRC